MEENFGFALSLGVVCANLFLKIAGALINFVNKGLLNYANLNTLFVSALLHIDVDDDI